MIVLDGAGRIVASERVVGAEVVEVGGGSGLVEVLLIWIRKRG